MGGDTLNLEKLNLDLDSLIFVLEDYTGFFPHFFHKKSKKIGIFSKI
jgi:hypothetical protein